MNYLVEYFVRNKQGQLINPCGSDYSFLVKDLKTLKGVINRAKKYAPTEAVQFSITTYTNLYDLTSYEMVYEGKL